MIHMNTLTSESVTCGHPDKVCDQIADAVLDRLLSENPSAHAGVEVAAGGNTIMVFGEIGGAEKPDIPTIVHQVLDDIGYSKSTGWDTAGIEIIDRIIEQSPEIDGGVSRTAADPLDAIGAGDQGMMIGYATNETAERLPLPFVLAHRITTGLERSRRDGTLPWLRPDGKAEVAVRYDDAGKPVVDTVLVSVQHGDIDLDEVARRILGDVIEPAFADVDHDGMKVLVNPCGAWHIGGPLADSGLTGRKLGVDKYGGLALDGGGALCGKDPSKVDRSGAYAARWIARTIVDSGLANRAQVQLAYAIGVPRPVSIDVDTFNTGIVEDEKITRAIQNTFDLRPAAIIRDLRLNEPGYYALGAHGHFGNTDRTWEQSIKADELIDNMASVNGLLKVE
jgi:S-adenosylmethionine synthetase